MFNYGHEQQAQCPSQGLLRPDRFLWARAVSIGPLVSPKSRRTS